MKWEKNDFLLNGRRIQFEQTMKKRFHGWRILGPVYDHHHHRIRRRHTSASPENFLHPPEHFLSLQRSLLEIIKHRRILLMNFFQLLEVVFWIGSPSSAVPFPKSNVLLATKFWLSKGSEASCPTNRPTDSILQQQREKWSKNTSALIRENNPWEFCGLWERFL